MKRNDNRKKPYGKTETVVKVRRAPGTPTKSQLKAAANAEAQAIKAQWQKVLGDAGSQWNKLHQQELAKVDGNFNVLAGLVQLRYRVSRQDADQQVKSFFDKHFQPARAAALN